MGHGFRRMLGRENGEVEEREMRKNAPDETREAADEGRGRRAQAQSEAPADAGPTNLVDVGEHIAAVLASAQEAAERMREEARHEAEQVRAEATEQAAAAVERSKRDAQRNRADADAYSKDMRERADAYAAEKRSEADEHASRAVADAEQRAEALREAAMREAAQIEREGRRRGEALAAKVRHYEERLQRLHAVFAAMTSQLAELVSPDAKQPSANGDAPAPGAEGERDSEQQAAAR